MKKILMVLICALVIGSSIMQAEEAADKTLSPYFLVKSADTSIIADMPLKSTSGDVKITGVIADVTVVQVYKNEGSVAIEAEYVFPASTRAAVYAMKMTIGDRTITAKIKEREQARQDYETAKAEGKTASLLEQERPNVFTMNVANILPGDEIKVELNYTELLVPSEGKYEFVYPTVVGPRYSNKPASTAAPDDQFVASPYQKSGKFPLYDFGLTIQLAAGMPIESIKCLSHKVIIDRDDQSSASVVLAPEEKNGGNRDFILRYGLRGKQVSTGLLLHEGEDENFFLMMVQPPERVATQDILPREYIFIVDVSGSMNGFPLEMSKKLMRNLLVNLRPDDRFNVLLFAGGSSVLSSQSIAATKESVSRAINFIAQQQGGGGTELLPALKHAYKLPHIAGMSRIVVIATDGYVDVEREAMDIVRRNLDSTNVFAFGIGTGVNRFLIEGLARAGMGEPFIIEKPDRAEKEAERFRKYITAPILANIKVSFNGFDAYDITPPKLPDLFAERPIILFGKYRNPLEGTVTIEGITGSGSYKASIRADEYIPDASHTALRQLWARSEIARLDDFQGHSNEGNEVDTENKKQVLALGLKYSLLTSRTSFVAIDEIVRRDAEGNLVTVKQALPLPVGVSNMAVGADFGSLSKVFSDSTCSMRWPVVCIAAVLLIGLAFIKRRLFFIVLVTLYFAGGCLMIPADHRASQNRESVTFIMGNDSGSGNDFYAYAAFYFRNDTTERTTRIVTDCRSLSEVKKYLVENPPKNYIPWGVVNIVSHGNDLTGLAAPVMPGSGRTTRDSLEEALAKETAIPEYAVDAGTEFRIQACAVGKDTLLLSRLACFFRSRSEIPRVTASQNFQMFVMETDGTGKRRCRKSEAAAAYSFFQLGKAPTVANNQSARNFDLAFHWTVTFAGEEDIPRLTTMTEIMTWMHSRKDLRKELASRSIPLSAMAWRLTRTTHRFSDGTVKPALKVDGYCSVTAILQPV
jgi:Ca-activated chloride channel homolog